MIDAFLYNGEEALLDVRLMELDGIVRYHLLLQAECDFRGVKSKKDRFNASDARYARLGEQYRNPFYGILMVPVIWAGLFKAERYRKCFKIWPGG